MSAEYKTFKTQDEYSLAIQEAVQSELAELAFEMAGNKKGLKLLANRIHELDRTIALLKARLRP